jgi:hypothetical protein
MTGLLDIPEEVLEKIIRLWQNDSTTFRFLSELSSRSARDERTKVCLLHRRLAIPFLRATLSHIELDLYGPATEEVRMSIIQFMTWMSTSFFHPAQVVEEVQVSFFRQAEPRKALRQLRDAKILCGLAAAFEPLREVHFKLGDAALVRQLAQEGTLGVLERLLKAPCTQISIEGLAVDAALEHPMELLPRLLEGLPSIRRMRLPNCNLAGDRSYPRITHLSLADLDRALPTNLSHTFPALSVFHLEMDDYSRTFLSALPPSTVELHLGFSNFQTFDNAFVQCFGSLPRLQRFRLLCSMSGLDAVDCDWYALLKVLPSGLLDFQMYFDELPAAYILLHITTSLLSHDPDWVPNLQRCTLLASNPYICETFKESEALFRVAAGKRRMLFERRVVSNGRAA